MCVIINVPEGQALPSLEVLTKCEANNKDGGGFAYVEDGFVHWEKGVQLSAEEIYEALKDKPGNKVIHFRIATSGGIKDTLCHPFPISRGVETFPAGRTKGGVLFHNGVWSEWRSVFLAHHKKRIKGDWSDTRLISQLVAELGAGALELITGSKFTILTPNAMEKQGMGWETIEGCDFSNTNWRYSFVSRGTGQGYAYGGMCIYGSCRNWPQTGSTYCYVHRDKDSSYKKENDTDVTWCCRWDNCYEKIPKKWQFCKKHHEESKKLVKTLKEEKEMMAKEAESNVRPFIPSRTGSTECSANTNRSGTVMLDNELAKTLISLRVDDETGAIVEDKLSEIIESCSHPIDYDEYDYGGES